MARYSILEAGFSSNDETINFGRRAIGGDETLYEICTLATIRSSDSADVSEDLQVKLCCHDGKIFFSINKILRIMQDKELSNQIGYLEFDSYIEEISVCNTFVLICTRDGKISIKDFSGIIPKGSEDYNTESDLISVFDEQIENENFGTFFIGSYVEDSNTTSFYIVTSQGLVKRLMLIKGTFKSEIIFNFERTINLCAFGSTHILLEGSQLILLDVTDKTYQVDDAIGLKNVNYIGFNYFGYDENGDIYGITPGLHVFCVNEEYPNFINSFVDLKFLIESTNQPKIQFIGVTKVTSESKSHIKLATFPELSEVYSIPLDYPIHLMKMGSVNEEVLFFSEVCKDGVVLELRLQYVYEADPELRLKRLLNKQLFDEAKRFAKTYNIDLEIVAQVEAQHIVNKVVCNSQDIDELLSILDRISDKLFRLNYCDIVECEYSADTRRILCYGASMEIDVRDSNENKDNALLNMKLLLNKKLHRFDTFMQVYKTYNYHNWNNFVQSNLIEEVKKFLTNGDIEGAIIIFNRLDIEAIYALTDNEIEEIIYIFNQQPDSTTSFLTSFIPITLKYRPEALGIFVEWLHGRVYQLEKYNRSNFPQCAIKFVESVMKLMNLNAPIRRQLNLEVSLNKLSKLVKALNDIEMLQNNFSVDLPLSEYLSDPCVTVRTLLTSNMDNSYFEEFTREFLCPFMLQNNLDIDSLLLEEVKNLQIYNEDYWINIVDILLKFIGCMDKKLEAIKQILETASVPWSDTVRRISKIVFDIKATSPLAKEIQNFLKEEDKVIILRKYNINWQQFVLSDNKMYYNRIFYLKGAAAIEDIHILCNSDNDRRDIDLIMIIKSIRNENYQQAMEVLDSNLSENIYRLSRDYIEYFLGSARCLSKKHVDFFYTALDLFWNRIKKHRKDPFYERQIEFDYKIAKALYNIQKTFAIAAKPSDLCAKQKRDVLLDNLAERISELVITDELSDLQKFISMCKKLSVYMNESLENILLKCLDKIDFDLVLQISQYVCETSKSSLILALFAVYLFKFLKNNFYEQENETFLDVFSNVRDKGEDYLKSVKVARKLAIQAIMYATSDDVLAVMEVLKWINSCYFLTNLKKSYINENLYQIYIPKTTAYPFVSSFEVIKSMFNSYCSFIVSSRDLNARYLTQFSTGIVVGQDQLITELQQFTWNLTTFLKEDQHLTAYNLIKMLQSNLLHNPEIKPETLAVLTSYIKKTWLPQTLDAVLSHKHVDKTLLLNLMLMVGNEFDTYLTKYLKMYKKRPVKLNIIAQVGLELLKFYNVVEGRNVLINILKMCKWWNKFRGTSMEYAAFFSAQNDVRLKDLIVDKQIDLNNIEEYCIDFQLNLQESYVTYLKTILLNWQPEVEYTTEVNGKKNFIVKNNEIELIKNCNKVIEHITDKNEVYKLTEKIWPMINFYYYEVFIVLLSIQSKLSTVKSSYELYRPLLSFLRTYTRISVPSRSEVEQWFGRFPFKALIDPLSAFRLPLSNSFLSSDIWNIVKPELNLQTYREWLKITSFLDMFLNKYDICTYAISNVWLAEISDNSSKAWELYPKYQHLVAEVDECAKNISDLERATAAVYTLMCAMPPGADKLNIAELSYKYAEMYKNSSSSRDVDNIYSKVKQRYFNYSAMHILYKHQLCEEKYLKQVAQPMVLITELYNDPRILDQNDNVTIYCPNINKAVNELCTLFELSTKKVRYELLSDFLQYNNLSNMDSSFVTQVKDIQDEGSNNLKRACYMCSGLDLAIWQTLLLKIGLNKDNSDTNMTFRANALRCFYYISDIETIQDMTGMLIDEFLNYVDKLLVIAQMTDLGLPFESVDQLELISKKKLLKKLTEVGGTLAIKCLASLCKIYNFDDLKYWEFIVNTAIKLNMIKELIDYVEYLKYRCVTDFIKKAWHVILSDAFLRGLNFSGATDMSDVQIKEGYVKTLRFLQTCPVMYALDFEVYIQRCLFKNQQDIAAVLFQYVPPEICDKYIEKILKSKTVFEDLEALEKEGIVGINKVIHILKK